MLLLVLRSVHALTGNQIPLSNKDTQDLEYALSFQVAMVIRHSPLPQLFHEDKDGRKLIVSTMRKERCAFERPSHAIRHTRTDDTLGSFANSHFSFINEGIMVTFAMVLLVAITIYIYI